MANQSDDKSASWREKYLNALDKHEQLEKGFSQQQELLRRTLVRVSVAADGQDEALDSILGQLRERMRGSISSDIEGLLSRLDQVALKFEQHREESSLLVRQSLIETVKPLQGFDLPRSVKKNISKYLEQLPEQSKKVRLYPALLKQLAHIQQQALKEIEQPKTSLLQKLLGSKTEASKADGKSPLDFDENSAKRVAVQHNENYGESTFTDSVQGEPHANLPTNLHGKILPQANLRRPIHGELPLEFIVQIKQIIHQFLVGLEKEAALVKKVHAIRELLNSTMAADAFIKALETLRDLMMQAYLQANQSFASYLKTVNQELTEIYTIVGGATTAEVSRREATDILQNSIEKEMASLESQAELATDLGQLKGQVKSQINNIRQALDRYQQAEQEQQILATQLTLLASKIKTMETDAEKNRVVLEKQRFKALHDPLTELPNREFYNERVNYEYQRWQRYKRPLTLAVFDIDFFKKINDGFGHQAGDKVLKVIGTSIAKRLREVDFFCRFGGEEFVGLLPETNLEDSMPLLDTIRAAIANASFNYKEQPIAITLSIGATEFRAGDDVETAFARADEALYAAKSSGRNCLKTL